MRASDGRLVHVNDVQNGLDCGCLCPACKSPLIARQGKRLIWHFAHVSEVDCDSAGETALHLAAKQTLKDLNGKIRIPEEVIRKVGWPPPNQRVSKPMARLNDLMTHTVPERYASESSVLIEPQDWAHQGFRPDAVLENDRGALLIEIRGPMRSMKRSGDGCKKWGLVPSRLISRKRTAISQPMNLQIS